MGAIGKLLLDYLWGKLLKEGIPALIKWAKDTVHKQKINKEVEEETSEIKEIKKQIAESIAKQKENGVDKPTVSPHLKAKLERAARKRVTGLQ